MATVANADSQLRTSVELGAEFLAPIHTNRDIETINFNLLYVWERWPEHPFTFGSGFTLSNARGKITQLNNNFEEINSATHETGLGPTFRLKYEPFVYRGFSPGMEFSGGILIYSDHFPPGGDSYNFMWRAGISVNYRSMDRQLYIAATWKWMHVSNGQGITDENPSYEAQGPGVTWSWYFK